MATGVLPLVLGRLTRLAQFYTASEKVYEGDIRFGFSTDTYDADGEPTSTPVENVRSQLDIEKLKQFAGEFLGKSQQTPPPYSAKKINGVPAYKLARSSKPVELKSAEVEITEFEILNLDGDRASFRARVSGGTYIRSIAHELGQRLGVGAHLASLRRVASSEFDIADAWTLDVIEKAAKDGSEAAIDALFVHPRRLLPGMPAVTATEQTVAMIRNGRPVNLPELSKAKQVKVFQGQTELIAIATRVAGTLFHPKVVLTGGE